MTSFHPIGWFIFVCYLILFMFYQSYEEYHNHLEQLRLTDEFKNDYTPENSSHEILSDTYLNTDSYEYVQMY